MSRAAVDFVKWMRDGWWRGWLELELELLGAWEALYAQTLSGFGHENETVARAVN